MMGKIFRLDGKRHAVSCDDVIVMEGPAVWLGRDSGLIELGSGDTITLLCSNMAPGEVVTITSDFCGATIFFRPIGEEAKSPMEMVYEL